MTDTEGIKQVIMQVGMEITKAVALTTSEIG